MESAGRKRLYQQRKTYGIMGVQGTMRQDHDGRQAARVFALLAVGASVTATATLSLMSYALAVTPCATSPGRQTEPGTHWYYQTDPVDHRQCWYLERLPTAINRLLTYPLIQQDARPCFANFWSGDNNSRSRPFSGIFCSDKKRLAGSLTQRFWPAVAVGAKRE